MSTPEGYDILADIIFTQINTFGKKIAQRLLIKDGYIRKINLIINKLNYYK